MTSKKKTAANRRNARHSTGPKTAAGKAKSSMNALRHGLRARTVVILDEKREDFDEILVALQNHYQPQNPPEQHLVDQAAIAQWKLVRAAAFEAKGYDKEESPKARAAFFDRMTQVEGRLERAFFKAYKELERIKASRQKQAEASTKSDQPDKPDKPDKPVKGAVRWVNSETGESELLCKLENGKAVPHYSDESP